MYESELGYSWDISWDTELETDAIIIDAGDELITLSKSDLQTMLKELE